VSLVSATPSVRLVTLGCARNDVDSEELAGRIAAEGFRLTDDSDADVTVVNTCGFVEAAKKDSIDALLAAADAAPTGRVVAVGCLAERYGAELAAALPEATVLSFDDYGHITDRLRDALDGRSHVAHVPRDRRELLPITPIARPAASVDVGIPGHAGGPTVLRRRLDDSAVAPLKLASGCDRRCSFCAIPSFRGAFVSRPPQEVLAEARWLAEHGVREIVLVSENSTSYGKDLGDVRALESLLPRLAAVDGISRVRLTYLQPAEVRPSLVDVMTSTPGVVPYFDLSFQHAHPALLRRMRRFGDAASFLALIDGIRSRVPDAGIRSNVIVGFPGETPEELATLEEFLVAARLDVVGVFGYSDEDGTHAANLPGKLDGDEIAARVERVTRLIDELMAQRAADRIGTTVEVLIDRRPDAELARPDAAELDGVEGRAAHQAPEVDGTTLLTDGDPRSDVAASRALGVEPGAIVPAVVVDTRGVDLVARPLAVAAAGTVPARARAAT
jgi:ribosomal protein S12 methylthiotransferase